MDLIAKKLRAEKWLSSTCKMEPNEQHGGTLRGDTPYVGGFLFNEEFTRVVLIKKIRPSWMAGKLNAVGGKIELNETPHEAMVREFMEETGLHVPVWNPYLVLSGSGFVVHCYWATADEYVLCTAQSKTDEQVRVYHVENVAAHPRMNNLRWMMEMAMSMRTERAAGFAVQETYGRPYRQA